MSVDRNYKNSREVSIIFMFRTEVPFKKLILFMPLASVLVFLKCIHIYIILTQNDTKMTSDKPYIVGLNFGDNSSKYRCQVPMCTTNCPKILSRKKWLLFCVIQYPNYTQSTLPYQYIFWSCHSRTAQYLNVFLFSQICYSAYLFNGYCC